MVNSDKALGPLWESLARGGCVYCAASLFSPMDRLAAANLAGALLTSIEGSRPSGFKISPLMVFLPFRDSHQTSLAQSDKSLQIFRLDIERLRRSSAVAARVEGLTVDSGVSMEIGYAYALGIPVFILKTGFMGEVGIANRIHMPLDPVIHSMAEYFSHPTGYTPIPESYYQTQLIHEHRAVDEFANSIIKTLSNSEPIGRLLPQSEKGSFYVDIMAGKYEWARREQAKLVYALVGQGYRVRTPKRYAFQDANPLSASQEDILAAASSEIGVFSADGAEMDAGSAAILGMMFALGRSVILQYSSPLLYSDGSNQTMRINLMIENAASQITDCFNDTLKYILVSART